MSTADDQPMPHDWEIDDGALHFPNFRVALHATDLAADPSAFVAFERKIPIATSDDPHEMVADVEPGEGVAMWFDGFEMLAVRVHLDDRCVITGRPIADDLSFGPRDHLVLPRDIVLSNRPDESGSPAWIVPTGGESRLRLQLFRQKKWARDNYIRLCTAHFLADGWDSTAPAFPDDNVRDIWEDAPAAEMIIQLRTRDPHGIQVRSSGSELPPSTTTS